MDGKTQSKGAVDIVPVSQTVEPETETYPDESIGFGPGENTDGGKESVVATTIPISSYGMDLITTANTLFTDLIAKLAEVTTQSEQKVDMEGFYGAVLTIDGEVIPVSSIASFNVRRATGRDNATIRATTTGSDIFTLAEFKKTEDASSALNKLVEDIYGPIYTVEAKVLEHSDGERVIPMPPKEPELPPIDPRQAAGIFPPDYVPGTMPVYDRKTVEDSDIVDGSIDAKKKGRSANV